MNNLKTPGIYLTHDVDVPTNNPGEGCNNATIIVLTARDDGDIFQFWISNNARSIYMRAAYWTSWSSWKVMFVW